MCRKHGRDCMWPPSMTGRTKACMACVVGKVRCIVGPPKAQPLKHNLEPEEAGPSGKHAKTGDIVVVESGSEPEWAPPQEDPRLHTLEYLSMQMQDQILIMDRGACDGNHR